MNNTKKKKRSDYASARRGKGEWVCMFIGSTQYEDICRIYGVKYEKPKRTDSRSR